MSRRENGRTRRAAGPRGGIGSSGGGAYVAPTIPQAILDLGGAFYWADDITDAAVWTPRLDTIAAGSFTGVNTTLETDGWVTPEGNVKSMRLASASSAYLRNDALAAMVTGDDAPYELIEWSQNLSANAANAIYSFSSSASTTPKRVVLFTTAGCRYTQQATTSIFTHNATNLLQQMWQFKQLNTAPGTSLTIWRNDEADPAGVLTQDVGAQAVDRFLLGAQWNGAGGPTNFRNCRIRGFYFRPVGGAPLSAAQRREIHDWAQNAFSAAPHYSDATSFRHFAWFGQSNCQGLAAETPAGVPDAAVRTYMRSTNNGVVNPTALAALDVRATYQGSWTYANSSESPVPHHITMVGAGATSAGSDWGGQNGAGPVNNLQGFYSTSLYSECRRNIWVGKRRLGGTPTTHIIWWQGENDAAAGAVVAGQYEANATAIFAYLRALVGDPVCHIYSVQLNPNQTGGGIVLDDLNTIRAGMVTLAGGDANVHLIETSDLTGGTYLQGDNLHYNAAGYSIIWDRIQASILANEP